jgi:pimeloyl-ACP methyl ester carboxylesterase
LIPIFLFSDKPNSRKNFGKEKAMVDYITKQNGERLHVAVYNEEATQPGTVFLIPGYHATLEAAPFAKIRKAAKKWCEENDTRMVTFEYTGHGESEGSMAKARLGTYLRDTRTVYKALCDFKEHGPVTIVGHSIGGWFAPLIAESIAKRAALRNEFGVAGVISMAPTLSLMGPNGYARQLLDDDNARTRLDTHGAILSPLGERTGMEYPANFLKDAHRLDLVGKWIAVNQEMDWGDKAVVVDAANFTWQPHPQIAHTPNYDFVFMHGDADPAAPREDIEAFAARIPTDRVEIITCRGQEHPRTGAMQPAGHGMHRDADLEYMVHYIDQFASPYKPAPFMREPAYATAGR